VDPPEGRQAPGDFSSAVDSVGANIVVKDCITFEKFENNSIFVVDRKRPEVFEFSFKFVGF